MRTTTEERSAAPARVRRPSTRVTVRPAASPSGTSSRTSAPLALHRSSDHRFARPRPVSVLVHPRASRPATHWYLPWYTHWWVHPWYRWVHATSVVYWVNYGTYAWTDSWVPAPRAGWVWVPGRWVAGVWYPGDWRPTRTAPMYSQASYVWASGFWMGGYWYAGSWRLADRPGWLWTDGYYLPNRQYVRGHWVPRTVAPQGYVWEPGFWDGAVWVEGFWRPEGRVGLRWVSSAFDEDGVYHAGYWEPIEDRGGHVWVPGWFDGHNWQEGYWVPQVEYDATDPSNWQPEPGWDEGWDSEDAEPVRDGPPLALPAGLGE